MLDKLRFSEEELSLYNPAFTGFILYSAIREYQSYHPDGMHVALAFIVLPMSLNQLISTNLPSTYRTPIAAWVASNEGLLADFPDQAEAYISIVRSSLGFLLDRGLLCLCDEGRLTIGQHNLVNNPGFFRQSADMSNGLRASKFLGRWFSHAPSVETVFAQLGVRP